MRANTGQLQHTYKLKSRTILYAFQLKSVIKALRQTSRLASYNLFAPIRNTNAQQKRGNTADLPTA